MPQEPVPQRNAVPRNIQEFRTISALLASAQQKGYPEPLNAAKHLSGPRAYQLEILNHLSTAAVTDHQVVSAISKGDAAQPDQVIVASRTTLKTRLTAKPQPTIIDYLSNAASAVTQRS